MRFAQIIGVSEIINSLFLLGGQLIRPSTVRLGEGENVSLAAKSLKKSAKRDTLNALGGSNTVKSRSSVKIETGHKVSRKEILEGKFNRSTI